MLMICGALIALILKAAFEDAKIDVLKNVDMKEIYLEVLIAPIILHASYSLYHPHFFGQIGTILILAFLATTLNVVVITPIVSLIYGPTHPDFNVFDSLTFASLISAVVTSAFLQNLTILIFPFLQGSCGSLGSLR